MTERTVKKTAGWGQLAFDWTVVTIALAAVYGYVANIVKMVGMLGDQTASVGEVIIRAIGIPLPMLGAIFGWF